jgi:hypothetical protein
MVKKSLANRARLGLPALQVSQATLAGEVTGTWFVNVEYPSLAAWADATTKSEADSETQALTKQFQAMSGVKVVSRGLYVDRTLAGVTPSTYIAGGVGTAMSVRVEGDPSAYFALIGKFAALQKKLGTPQSRVWQGTAAGEDTGAIWILNSYPSVTAMDEAQKKVEADPDWQGLVREARGMKRTVLTNFLVRDRTPK